MVDLFKWRRGKKPMYSVAVYCSRCMTWYKIEDCDVGKGNVLLCPVCHKIVRRNRR